MARNRKSKQTRRGELRAMIMDPNAHAIRCLFGAKPAQSKHRDNESWSNLPRIFNAIHEADAGTTRSSAEDALERLLALVMDLRDAACSLPERAADSRSDLNEANA